MCSKNVVPFLNTLPCWKWLEVFKRLALIWGSVDKFKRIKTLQWESGFIFLIMALFSVFFVFHSYFLLKAFPLIFQKKSQILFFQISLFTKVLLIRSLQIKFFPKSSIMTHLIFNHFQKITKVKENHTQKQTKNFFGKNFCKNRLKFKDKSCFDVFSWIILSKEVLKWLFPKKFFEVQSFMQLCIIQHFIYLDLK